MEERAGKIVVAMKGHPGTGKSTVARALAAALRCPLLDKDDVRDSTVGLESPAAVCNDLSYEVMWRIAETQLGLGLGVVIDSPLSRRAHLDRLRELVGSCGGARLVMVECRPGDQVEWRRRVEERGAEAAAGGVGWHKPATWRDMERLLEGYGGCTDYDVGDVPKLVLDTTAAGVGVAELVETVMEFLVIIDDSKDE